MSIDSMDLRDELKTFNQEEKIKKEPYEPYIMKEPLESHYFPPGVLGFTRLNNRFVIHPDLYGEEITFVRIHEEVHNLYKTGDEGFVESVTRYKFRNKHYD